MMIAAGTKLGRYEIRSLKKKLSAALEK